MPTRQESELKGLKELPKVPASCFVQLDRRDSFHPQPSLYLQLRVYSSSITLSSKDIPALCVQPGFSSLLIELPSSLDFFSQIAASPGTAQR